MAALTVDSSHRGTSIY